MSEMNNPAALPMRRTCKSSWIPLFPWRPDGAQAGYLATILSLKELSVISLASGWRTYAWLDFGAGIDFGGKCRRGAEAHSFQVPGGLFCRRVGLQHAAGAGRCFVVG